MPRRLSDSRFPIAASRVFRIRVFHHEAVGEPNHSSRTTGERQVVRDQHDARAGFAVQFLDELDDPRAGVGIEVAGRLIGEENAWTVREGTRDRNAPAEVSPLSPAFTIPT